MRSSRSPEILSCLGKIEAKTILEEGANHFYLEAQAGGVSFYG